uniref:Uncharacterized protein n=1 Tax=Anopheles minimus TaxID=112268 RepID=A0A182W3C2_9DIPT
MNHPNTDHDEYGQTHVIHKVNYVASATPTTLKLATVSEGSHLHLQPVSSVVTEYNYAVPQLAYAQYPQYQVYHHHQASPGTVQPSAIYAAHQLHEHPVATATVHEIAHQHQQQQQQQQHTAYAHQQPIYAHHPAAIHYSVPASLVHAGQHNYQQQQQQQQLPLSHTQAIHYQTNQAGAQPAVPIVHQAPIATINQVHQAQQVYATQGQLTKYPLAAQSYYGAGGLQQNQIYSTVPSYGDPDTLTNLVNPTTPRFLTTSRRTSARPIPGDIRPITEYEDDDGSDDGNSEDGVLYRDEPTVSSDRIPGQDEPCEKDGKKAGQPSAFSRNLYNMWRAYDVARTLLKASGASGASVKPRSKPDSSSNTDRIQLIHPPGESDKRLKGKYYEGKYYGYYRHGRQDTAGDGNRTPKSVQPTPLSSSSSSSSSSVSYTAFTQPPHAGSVPLAAHLKPVPQSLLQTQPSYFNAVAASTAQQQQHQTLQQQPNVYYRNQLQQQQQQQQQQAQQQQRVQIYSTAASPLQRSPLLYSAGQLNHPVPSQYATYAYAPQQHSVAAGALFQPQASQGKITYAQHGVSPNVGGRGSIYLLH